MTPLSKTYSQKLQIIEYTTTPSPPSKSLLPTALILIAMRKCDMAMSEWEVLCLIQLLQSNDKVIGWNIHPAALGH